MPSHAQPPRSSKFHPSDPVAVNALRDPVKSKKAVPLDIIALILLMCGANYFLLPEGPGWLQLNPTPWLLIPIYVGARHGLFPGLIASLLSIGAIIGWRYVALGELPAAVLQSASLVFGGLLISGQVAGLAHKVVTGRLRRLQEFALDAGRDNLRLAEEIAIFRENEATLQEALLLHGAEYTALTEELGQLFANEESELEAGLLELFHQHLGVTASAIYNLNSHLPGEPVFSLEAERGGSEEIILESLSGADSRMISAALSGGKIVAASQMLDDPDVDKTEPILAVIPWGERPGDADSLCVIYRMTFDRVNWETLGRIEAIFDWVMARRSLHETSNTGSEVFSRIYPPAPFRRLIERAKQAEKTLHIASRLIIFSPKSEKLNPDEQTQFVNELQESIRVTDSLGAMISLRGDYAIGLLSRFSTDKAAELYASRLRELSGIEEIDFQVYDLFHPSLEQALSEAEAREAVSEKQKAKKETAPIPPQPKTASVDRETAETAG